MIPLATLLRLGKGVKDAMSSNSKSNSLEETQTAVEGARINIDEFYGKWDKAFYLFTSGILTDQEFAKQKKEMMELIRQRGIRQRPLDALGKLLPLIKTGAISIEEAKNLNQIFRG